MNLLASLKPNPGAKHYTKRLGRGRGSGLGQTSGKGHKGQLARTGGKVRRGFEGGQSPLTRRLPKFGFSNVDFATEFQIVNLSQLSKCEGEVTPETLRKLNLVGKGLVKVLGNGKLSSKLVVRAHKFSKAATAAIEAAGGRVEVIK